MKHYRLREVPLRTADVEPRGSIQAGWSFWTKGFAVTHPGCHRPVKITYRGPRSLWLAPPQDVPLPLDFLAADNAEAAHMLGLPETLIAVLYARYNAADIVPRPEE